MGKVLSDFRGNNRVKPVSIRFLFVQVPKCGSCGGVLKPEIVFFGDNVPKPTVELVNSRLDESDAMLVIGSSMEVNNNKYWTLYRPLILFYEQSLSAALSKLHPPLPCGKEVSC